MNRLYDQIKQIKDLVYDQIKQIAKLNISSYLVHSYIHT